MAPFAYGALFEHRRKRLLFGNLDWRRLRGSDLGAAHQFCLNDKYRATFSRSNCGKLLSRFDRIAT